MDRPNEPAAWIGETAFGYEMVSLDKDKLEKTCINVEPLYRDDDSENPLGFADANIGSITKADWVGIRLLSLIISADPSSATIKDVGKSMTYYQFKYSTDVLMQALQMINNERYRNDVWDNPESRLIRGMKPDESEYVEWDALYTAPPKRELVWLANEEIVELFEKYHDKPFSLILATQDKIKERNT